MENMKYNATDLRKDIYRVLDRILETGEAVDIERNGHLLRIVPVSELKPVERLRSIADLIVGDPASIEHIDWADEWKP